MRNKLLFSIFVFFFISIFIALGSWQLVRLDWKNELLNKIDLSLKKEAVDLMTNVPEDYLKIKTSGVIDFDKQIYLYSLNGTYLNYLVPCALTNTVPTITP